jgi:hypothetical protein
MDEIGAAERLTRRRTEGVLRHGSTKAKRVPEQYGHEERARLLKKMNEIADRFQPEQPAE